MPATKTPKEKKPLYLHLSTNDKVTLSRHLAAMLEAGIPLHESLAVLEEQIATPTLQYVLRQAIRDLGDGAPLYKSFAKFPRLFDPFFVNIMSVGESSGTLPATLRYLATQLEKSEDLHGKVISAVIYPAIVFCGALGIGAYLAFFMLPKILPLFVTLKVKLPPTTRALLAFSGWAAHNWPWIVVALVALVIGGPLLMRNRRFNYAVHSFTLSLPVVKDLTRNLQTAKFSRILGTLLTSGITIVTALNITAESTDDPVYARELGDVAKAVERGGTVSGELRAHPRLFARTTASMVGVGERTGKLSDSLITLAEFSEREVDTATRNLSTLIEPITLVMVGLLVGFVALSIITPIYQITQGIHT